MLLSFFPLLINSFLFLEKKKLMKCQNGKTFSSAEGKKKKLVLLKDTCSLFPNASSICTLC